MPSEHARGETARYLLPAPSLKFAKSRRLQASKEVAVQVEASLLAKYDYAWNQRLNGRKRNIILQPRWCFFCITVGVEVVETQYQSPAKGNRPSSPSKPALPSPQKPRAAKQLQFVVSA